MAFFTDGKRIELSEIKKEFNLEGELLHDSIADATDGSEPCFHIESIGWITLIIEDDTGSTLCEIDEEEYYLYDLLEMIKRACTV